jgi:hypothetical protein
MAIAYCLILIERLKKEFVKLKVVKFVKFSEKL